MGDSERVFQRARCTRTSCSRGRTPTASPPPSSSRPSTPTCAAPSPPLPSPRPSQPLSLPRHTYEISPGFHTVEEQTILRLGRYCGFSEVEGIFNAGLFSLTLMHPALGLFEHSLEAAAWAISMPSTSPATDSIPNLNGKGSTTPRHSSSSHQIRCLVDYLRGTH